MKQIKERWNLPKEYLEFLEKNESGIEIDDVKEDVEDEFGLANGIALYGYSNLIKNQDGYSYNSIKKEVLEEWPKDYVVIADTGADPFVLDLSQSNGSDAPVLFAYHGEGKWDFKKHFDSFKIFLDWFNSLR